MASLRIAFNPYVNEGYVNTADCWLDFSFYCFELGRRCLNLDRATCNRMIESYWLWYHWPTSRGKAERAEKRRQYVTKLTALALVECSPAVIAAAERWRASLVAERRRAMICTD